MKLDAITLANLVLITGIFLFTTIQEVNSKGGGRGGGGGSRGGGSRYSGGGWGSRGSSGGYKSISGSSTKSFAPKSSSNWKKAATFGAGAYVGYKVSSMLGGAYRPIYYGGHYYNYNNWNSYARVDGWVCRDDRDCTWIDPYLGCDDREFSVNYINGAWPWKNDLKGRCACRDGFWFHRDDGQCITNGGWLLPGWLLVAILIGALIAVSACCFCACKFFKYKTTTPNV